MNKGTIVQIIGSVVDVQFAEPARNASHSDAGGEHTVHQEVPT